jgi:LPXTG-site transpeptidase (sortase) family protein
MSSSGTSRAGGFTAGLLVLCGLLMAAGYLLPSSGSADDGYHALASPAAPVRLVIPALKVRAPIEPIQVDDQGVLDPPRNPREVGWWKRSARPGATRGQTVLTGHTVHTGGGVMDHLGRLHKGQLVKVVTRKGTMVYRTSKVMTLSKAELARRSVQLFGQQRTDDRLVLITCSGWTGSEYTSNVVVFAEPLGVADAKKAQDQQKSRPKSRPKS